jgi:hypothetical protein
MILKLIIVIILIYLVYKLFNKYNKNEHLDISYDDYINNPSSEDCYKRQISDSDFSKKVYSMNEGELIFY